MLCDSRRALIINADDFGWDNDTAKTTIDLFENGSLTSATIMTGRQASHLAIQYAKANKAKFSFGLHFNIVDGHIPLAAPTPNSLVNRDGFFEDGNTQIKKALFCLIDADDLRKELEAQLSFLCDNGVNVTHLDSHGHLHKFPYIISSIKPVLSKYRISLVRVPQNQFQTYKIGKLFLNRLFKLFFCGLKFPDSFFMLDDHKDNDWFRAFINSLKPGVTELGIHPGTVEDWRLIEAMPFQTNQARMMLNSANIKKMSFRDLKE